LRLQAAHRGIKRIEDTHNEVSKFDTCGRRRDCHLAVIETRLRKVRATLKDSLIHALKKPGFD
jgi:hypothetical protein